MKNMKTDNFNTIILEGANGVGKSTLRKWLLKEINYFVDVYDRGEISNIYYAQKFNRKYTPKNCNNILFIFLTPSWKERVKRLIVYKHENIDEIDFEENDKMIKLAYQLAKKRKDIHIIFYDNSRASIMELAAEIRRLLFIQNDKGELKWKKYI